MLFFLILLGIIIIISLIIFLLLASTIKLKIQNLKVNNGELNQKYNLKFQIYVFDKLKILSINLNKGKIKDITSKQIKKIDIKKLEGNVKIDKKLLQIIKKINIKIEKLKLYISLGVEDAVITSYLTAIIAGLIGIVLPHATNNIDNCKYIVQPLYNAKNEFNMYLDSIISVKIVHIIYVIYILIMKGRDKNERTSNRRPYDYSYGQY